MDRNSPLNTADQAEIESQACRLLQLPEVRSALRQAADYWLGKVPPVTAGVLQRRFGDAVEQSAFFALLQLANGDALRPKFHATPLWSHTVDGMRVPGTMAGIPNPDCIYRYAPVDAESEYVIQGSFPGGRSQVNDFSLVTRRYETLANINGRDLQVAADGTFTITLDPRPADGRKNHLQSREGAALVLVRDTLSDWSTELPSRLSIQRVGGAQPLTAKAAQLTGEAAAAAVMAHINEILWGLAQATAKPVNTLVSPELRTGASSKGGFLVTQSYAPGHYRIAADEALIIRARMGAARYMTVPLSDVWSITGDFTERTLGYNHTQAARDPDGAYTFVISLEDPGVHNWLDPEGMQEGIVFVRWSAFDAARYEIDPPTVESRLVPLSKLWDSLPTDTARLDAKGRRDHLAARARQYHWRK